VATTTEKIGMASWLLCAAAAIEAVTGVALIIDPQAVADLLLGKDLGTAGIAVARVAGIALLSLGLGCWMSRKVANQSAALTAIFTYNLLVTMYLMFLALVGELVGILLWPAIAIHAAFTLLLAYSLIAPR
jgi:predicted membrane-bound spermidine synthase